MKFQNKVHQKHEQNSIEVYSDKLYELKQLLFIYFGKIIEYIFVYKSNNKIFISTKTLPRTTNIRHT